MARLVVQLQRRAASVKSAGLAGIKTFQILVMVNTKKNSFGNIIWSSLVSVTSLILYIPLKMAPGYNL